MGKRLPCEPPLCAMQHMGTWHGTPYNILMKRFVVGPQHIMTVVWLYISESDSCNHCLTLLIKQCGCWVLCHCYGLHMPLTNSSSIFVSS